MPQQRVYHEYVNEKLIPYWYVLTFKSFEINWDKPIHYFDVIKPFEYFERDQFDESIITFSLYKTDFLLNADFPNKLGINLKSIKKRLTVEGIDPQIVHQFIVPIPDVDEVLNLIPNKRKINFNVEIL
ncbi:hypothetical protein P9D39_03450 [Heyndrickxia oleronia]|uniref:Uncharacterized protein n=1 Tax=Heyndrickxia oleronia TaxID=38875 RepID=A0A8E2I9B3_9BACI|nr:hypothetical protein [Heyndrickxia oleronia]MEC1373366.1 hypothetical protein [Heyndrickxia oleronia]OOP65791.1 hypothetical protein BWZ43_24385 [Heyndrickxia oleronia]QQZ04337.1 hypothetical protein I5818_22095 [Heyndrickxia oleronia]